MGLEAACGACSGWLLLSQKCSVIGGLVAGTLLVAACNPATNAARLTPQAGSTVPTPVTRGTVPGDPSEVGGALLAVTPTHATGPCFPLTAALCVDHDTDYALRVRNDSDRPVLVAPWQAAPEILIPGHDDRVVPTDGYPAPPWHILARWQGRDAVLFDRMLRGPQDEIGPSHVPFPRVFSFYIGVQQDGTVTVCPGNCGRA
jgi:hypothetical protein